MSTVLFFSEADDHPVRCDGPSTPTPCPSQEVLNPTNSFMFAFVIDKEAQRWPKVLSSLFVTPTRTTTVPSYLQAPDHSRDQKSPHYPSRLSDRQPPATKPVAYVVSISCAQPRTLGKPGQLQTPWNRCFGAAGMQSFVAESKRVKPCPPPRDIFGTSNTLKVHGYVPIPRFVPLGQRQAARHHGRGVHRGVQRDLGAGRHRVQGSCTAQRRESPTPPVR